MTFFKIKKLLHAEEKGKHFFSYIIKDTSRIDSISIHKDIRGLSNANTYMLVSDYSLNTQRDSIFLPDSSTASTNILNTITPTPKASFY